jgi:hypothetical protein
VFDEPTSPLIRGVVCEFKGCAAVNPLQVFGPIGGLVPCLPLRHEVRAAPVLPRNVARAHAAQASKHDEVRYFDIHEDDDLDEDQLVAWIEQASNLPGEKCSPRPPP